MNNFKLLPESICVACEDSLAHSSTQSFTCMEKMVSSFLSLYLLGEQGW